MEITQSNMHDKSYSQLLHIATYTSVGPVKIETRQRND